MVQAPEERFTGRVEDYRKYRPDYPSSVTDEIVNGAAFASRHITAVDIGAGTGISSRLLAAAGWTVIALEPNAEMRASLEAEELGDVVVREGTAEATGLPDAHADVVTAFQAFHWFNGSGALEEFHRILRPQGRVGLVWNIQSQSDPFTREYSRIVEGSADADVRDLILRKHESGDQLLSSPLFEMGRKAILRHSQELDFDSLLGRVRSASYLPKEGPEYDRIMDALKLLYQEWAADGMVQLIYDVFVYVAQRRA